MTLEKDKEGQSKYYLNYPKPPVLKWANRECCTNINVAEWANIPKFSTLDDTVTSLRLLELFFDGVLVIFGYTKLYSHKEKADIRFEITVETLRLFLSMLLLSGYHKLLDRKMCWEATPDIFV